MNTNEPTTPSAAPTPETAGPFCCRKCGKPANEIGGFLHRVNPVGELPARWECRPSCESMLKPGESLLAAIGDTPSAVEWVKERLFTQWDDDGNAQWYLCKTDALELARRCEEAEAKHEAFRDAIRTKEANELVALSEVDTLRAQLAAAQTEAREIREALEWLEDEAPRIINDSWTNSVDMSNNRWTLTARINGPTQKFRGRTLIETVQKARYAAALAKQGGER